MCRFDGTKILQKVKAQLLAQEGRCGAGNVYVNIALNKGGVEPWLQGELSTCFAENAPAGGVITCEKETHIYTGDRPAVDFAVTYPGHPPVYVELKAESLHQSAYQGRVHGEHIFYTGVQEDCVKLENNREPALSAHPAYALAILISLEAQQGMESWLRHSQRSADYEFVNLNWSGAPWTAHIYVVNLNPSGSTYNPVAVDDY